VSSLDFYWTCPRCGARIKLRSFAAVIDIEDVFDAFAEWLRTEGAAEVIQRRKQELETD
jgi:hypothetical protein